MNVENPIAFRFILQDDIYLLNNEKALFTDKQPETTPVAEARPIVPPILEPIVAKPITAEVIAEPTTPQPVVPVIQTPPVSFNYLGNYKKSLLIIVHYTDTDFIADRHLIALEAILGRLSFSLDDVAILNRANFADATFERLHAFFKPQRMLLLGNQALPNGIGVIALNKPKQINNCNILFSFSFDEMMDNTDYKKAFWEQMKQL